MRYKNIILPLATAAIGFAAGWYAHEKKTADETTKAVEQVSDMYKAKIKEADDLFQSVTYENALNRLDELKQEEAKNDVERWRSTLHPGFFTVEEYNQMFKTPAPEETLEENDKIKKEEMVSKPRMDWHGDPTDDIIEGEEPPEYDAEDAQINLAGGDVIFYIPPGDVGQAPYYQKENLVLYADGILADDAYNVVPQNEIADMLGDDYEEHFGEFEDEALWVMNGRNHVYYEVIRDSRTYREAMRG